MSFPIFASAKTQMISGNTSSGPWKMFLVMQSWRDAGIWGEPGLSFSIFSMTPKLDFGERAMRCDAIGHQLKPIDIGQNNK